MKKERYPIDTRWDKKWQKPYPRSGRKLREDEDETVTSVRCLHRAKALMMEIG